MFKSEPELASGNNKNWCDLVTGHDDGHHDWAGVMGHAPSLCCEKHQDRVSHKHNRSIKRNFIPVHFRCVDTTECDSDEARDLVAMTGPVT